MNGQCASVGKQLVSRMAHAFMEGWQTFKLVQVECMALALTICLTLSMPVSALAKEDAAQKVVSTPDATQPTSSQTDNKPVTQTDLPNASVANSADQQPEKAETVALQSAQTEPHAPAQPLNAMPLANSIAESHPIAASDTASTSIPKKAAESPRPSELSVIQPVLALLAVFGIMFVIAWVLKKGRLLPTVNKDALKSIGTISLGGKTCISVVEVGEHWLVVGATPQQVTLLHVLPKQTVQQTPATPNDVPFKTWLDTTLKKFNQQRPS